MKKYLIILMLILVPAILMAQTAGGAVKRPVKKKQTTTTTTTQRSVKKQSVPPQKKQTEKPRQAAQALSPVLKNLVNNMVRVGGGTFTMGATAEQGSDAFDDEKPAHKVTLSSFSIGKYEVTQEEWQAVMGSNPSRQKGAKRPVHGVSWDDCRQFIRKLNSLTGKNFRFPTEAEWEFAARGGNKSCGYKYAGSQMLDDVGWYDGNSPSFSYQEVGQLDPNELGLYDMSGNVWEWCSDRYGSYDSVPQTNPTGAPSDSIRIFVLRGGCSHHNERLCRVSTRSSGNHDSTFNSPGLRLAL